MRRTLFTRVFGSYLLTVVIGLVVLSAVGSYVLLSAARRDSLRQMVTVAELAASLLLRDASGRVDPTLPLPTSDALGTTISLLAANGAVVAGEANPPIFAAVNAAIGTGRLPRSGFAEDRVAGEVFAYAVAGIGDDQQQLYVYLTRARAPIDRRALRPLIVVLGTALLFTVVLAMLIYRTLRWINDPIYAIQGAARRYAQGELETHLRTNGPPELQRLADDLNLMAHQLRNRISAISEQRNQLEAILSSMLEGVVVLDEGRGIVSMNDAAGRLLGVAPAEAHGRTLIEFLRNAQLDELAELALAGDEPIERTITLYRERPIHVQIHATAVRNGSAPRPTGSLLVVNDITRLKHLEELRKDFVANVSHELKTPITSIKGFVETLLDEPNADKHTLQRFLGIILNHTNRLHLIIEDLLTLSRLEQSDQRVTFSRFPIQAVLDATLEICGPHAEAKGISIATSITGEPSAWGNPNLLEQALVNLVDNAVKYSEEGRSVELESERTDALLTLRVTDHGPGIRAHDLPRIFERFYRTDRARSRELGGTGLGLAIVKHIARSHRGEVRVESTFGSGSVFTIEIPQENRQDSRRAAQVTSPITT